MQYRLITDAGVPTMLFVVHYFHIEEKQIDMIAYRLDYIRIGVPARIKDRVYPPATALTEHGSGEFRLHERFSSRQGHATAGLFIKSPVFFDFTHYVFNRNVSAYELKSPRVADIKTRSAQIAVLAVKSDDMVVIVQRTFRTNTQTLSAVYASVRRDHEFGRVLDTLGIVAPRAAQRAALQEYGRAYARTVVYGILFYVKNKTFHVNIIIPAIYP